MYSLIRVWIGLKLGQDADPGQRRRQDDEGDRQPVDAELVLDPEERDPGAGSTNWKPGAPGQVADQQQQRHDPRQRAPSPSASGRA